MSIKFADVVFIFAILIFVGLTFYGAYALEVTVPKLEQQNKALQQENKALKEKVKELQQQNAELQRMQLELVKSQQKMLDQLQKKDDRIKNLENRSQKRTSSTSRGRVVRELKNVQVTWYNISGVTKSGRRTVDGVTAAVDPRLIPLGSWMEIVLPDGQVLVRRADDTGAAVKGKVVDIYANAPTRELQKRGRMRNVTVRILK